MDSSVNIRGVSKKFDKVEALKDINIEVNSGELFGLIGPDGSGKTTLLRILVSLLLPDKGVVEMCGLNVVDDYKKIRRLVGYMPGRFSLYQDLSVEENLNFFSTVFGTTRTENMDLIKDIWVQIEPFRKRQAGKLSGGMKQKLALCCALIHKPEVLILDEPTTGVDAVSRKEFWEMLKGLKKSNITIVVSTPYMDEASLCERVALIQNGEILSIDKPEIITKNFKHKLFSISGGNLYMMVNDLKLYVNTNSVFLFGREIHYTDKRADADKQSIIEFLHEKGHKNMIVETAEANIEDCFMELMKK
ncbi:ABC transporter ATP-binding protein [Bacteroidota bacterium]